eukprot:1355385-Prymnesium_polylepis.1
MHRDPTRVARQSGHPCAGARARAAGVSGGPQRTPRGGRASRFASVSPADGGLPATPTPTAFASASGCYSSLKKKRAPKASTLATP